MMNLMRMGVGVGVGAVAGYWLWRKYFSFPNPKVWEEAGEVVELNLFPMKSGRRVRVVEAQATKHGLESGTLQDRSFMVVTEEGRLVTGRQAGRLLTVGLTLTEDKMLTLDAKGHYSVTVDLKTVTSVSKVIHSKIWDEHVKGMDCGEEVAGWLTDVLYEGTTKVRLIYKGGVMEGRPPRRLPYYDFPRIKKSDSIYYADTAAFLVTNEDSLADLNARLPTPFPIARFRGNIIVGKTPGGFVEDSWVALKIGDVVIRKIKPCERCIMTTIDPESGERHPDEEPLKTLRTYRIISEPPKLTKLWATKPVFGATFALDNPGRIKVGDKVFAATAAANPHISVF